MKTIAFFNNKGGVGKTSLVYHLAWKLGQMGHSVLAVDLDPQANLTSMFLDDETVLEWDRSREIETIYRAVRPLIERLGDVADVKLHEISSTIRLLAGELELSEFEDSLAETWPKCLIGDVGAFRVTTAFSRAISRSGKRCGAAIALIDVGPNFGAINRSALIAADFVVVPVSPDLFSVRGLENAGPKLNSWRLGWSKSASAAPSEMKEELPSGNISPIGYIVSRFNIQKRGPVKAFQRWLDKIPASYIKAFDFDNIDVPKSIEEDKFCLARLKDYASLMPLAQQARKPMFMLKPSDGALGGHQAAVNSCGADFEALAKRILDQVKAD